MEFVRNLRRPVDFYKLLEEISDLILDSAKALKYYVETFDVSYAEKVKQLEKNADEKLYLLSQELSKTFITPFEKEDIYILSKSLDDILDYYKTTVKQIEIYEIEPSIEIVKMITILEEGTENICNAVYAMKNNKKTSIENAMKAKKCENKVENLYRISVAKLLKNQDIKYIMKMRELYRHLSNCADKIDNSADLITHILMKLVC